MTKKFNKNVAITGKIGGIFVSNGEFVDADTGEIVNIAKIFETVFGENEFCITAKLADKSELDVIVEDGDTTD